MTILLRFLALFGILLVNAGRDILTNRIKGAGTEPLFFAIGTTNTAEAATQTALAVEVETRNSGTSTRQTVTVTNDTYQVVGTITATAPRSVVEAGLFDASTVGNMLVRGIFGTVTLAIGDSIQGTVKLTFT